MLLSTAVHSSTPSSCNDCCQVEVTQCLCTSTSYSPTSKHTTITLICPVFHSLHQNDVIHTIHHLSHTVLVVVQKVFFFSCYKHYAYSFASTVPLCLHMRLCLQAHTWVHRETTHSATWPRTQSVSVQHWETLYQHWETLYQHRTNVSNALGLIIHRDTSACS